MKQWTTRPSKYSARSERNISEHFKSEMLDTRIVVSQIFSEQRLRKGIKDFRAGDSRVSIARKK